MKVWNYMIIMITMIIFLEFTGFHTTAGGLLDKVGVKVNNQTSTLETGDVSQSNFWLDLFGDGGFLITVSIAGAVIVGFFTKQFDWKLVLVPFMTGTIVLFGGTGWAMIQYAQATGQNWLTAIVATIFLPLTIGFIYSIVEWFGGTE